MRDASGDFRGDSRCDGAVDRCTGGAGGAGGASEGGGGAGNGGAGSGAGGSGGGLEAGKGGNADDAGDARSDGIAPQPETGPTDGPAEGRQLCNGDAACVDSAVDVESGVVDRCPADPLKTDPGTCGCGVPDTDSDVDGTADCVDACPTDPLKTQAGICGCSAADPSNSDAGQAFCLKAFLAHRYSFNGTGTVATDSIGTAHGTIHGGTNAVLGSGSLDLAGDRGTRYMNEGYVELPSALLAPFTSATFEAWVTWRGTGSSGSQTWQRLFDFGSVTSGTDPAGSTYLFLSTRASGNGFPRTAYTTNGSMDEIMVTATRSFPLNVATHVAVVVDDAGDRITLYLDGTEESNAAWPGRLADIVAEHSWLGRSSYIGDPELNGIFHEFRVYRIALLAAQVRASYLAGPDPTFF